MGKKVKKEVEPPPKDVFDPLTIESKKTGTVVLMLKSDEEEVLTKACEAIYKFADKCDENKLMLLELGAMEQILRLIHHEERVVKRFAVMSFGVMAGNAEVRRFLRKRDCTSEAIQLLGDEDDVCNEFASLFLAHMSTEFTSKHLIFKNDGLEPLVNLLESPDPDIQKNSLQAITNLSQDFEIHPAIRELGGMGPLLEFLKSDYAVIQELALTTLAALTRNAEARALLLENNGLEQLVNFLNHKEYEDLHVHAVRVLANCLEDKDSLDEFRNTGGMDNLLTFARESATPEVQTNTLKALAWSAKSVQNAKILHEQETEKTLITLCGSDNDAVKIAACQAVGTLSEYLPSRNVFGKSEGIPPLMNLLTSDSADVKEAAILALANLTVDHPANCSEILTLGGAEQLMSLLSCKEEGVVVNVLACLMNMSNDEAVRSEIQKHGIITALSMTLKSESVKILGKAAQAIGCFVCDVESRVELLKCGGIAPLVQHLRSSDSQLCKDASWAIFSICVDPPTAAALSNLGTIELLQQINGSRQKKNNFSLAAYGKLLDLNLPAKYSLTGRLEEHNVTSDGFYDCGLLPVDAKFKSLEELAAEEVNQKRPVIVINCKSAEPLPSEELSELVAGDSESQIFGTSIIPTEVVEDAAYQSVKLDLDEVAEKRVSSKASMTRRKKKEKDALAAEEKLRAENEEKVYRPPMDTALKGYIEDVTKFIQPMSTSQEQIISLAQYVSERMGGEVERGKLMEYTWELELAKIKFDLNSNIVPIGKIQKGIFYHRALLFKVLADKIAVPCTLVQVEYGRAWNEVKISMDQQGKSYSPVRYIVDLMHDVGRLIRSDSPEAAKYQSL